MLQVHKHLARIGDVVIVDDIGEHVDRRNRDTGRIDDVHALLNGVLGAPLLDLGLERGVVLAAVNVGVKARILKQVGAVERLGTQEREELVVAAADDEASVAGLEGVIREGGGDLYSAFFALAKLVLDSRYLTRTVLLSKSISSV